MVKKWRKFIPPVTILILIDGFLQYINIHNIDGIKKCHNPYFNRWFSAIIGVSVSNKRLRIVTILILIDGFLQYKLKFRMAVLKQVTILILIDGFLQ